MQVSPFITFEKFNDQLLALELGTILKEHNIEYEYENVALSFDVTFAANELRREFRIKLRQEDFEKARQLLEEISRKQIGQVDSDYYLFDFTDPELLEIASKRDEWGSFDYVLAQKILDDRGKGIMPHVIDSLKSKRIEELSQPEARRPVWIYIAYILALLGGILGFIMSLHLIIHKKKLPNGNIVHAFSETDRRDGKNIMIISAIVMGCWLLSKIYDIVN